MKPFDANGMFRPVAEGGTELRRLAVRGAGATLFSRGVLLAIHIVSAVILARLLLPADFGIVAMVSTFSLLFTAFSGFTEAVLQREQIDQFLASNLFWISVGIGILLTIAFASVGPLLARFYGDSRLVLITIVLSLQIFLSSLSVLHLALLMRAMRFNVVSANDVVARFIAGSVSVILAFAGFGYWALVWGLLVFPLCRSIGAWWLCRWIPGLPRRLVGTRSVMRFVAHVYGRFNIEYCAHNMDNVLVGWRLGAQPLGFYKKAYDLFALPVGRMVRPLQAVAVASLSRFKSDPFRYRRYLFRVLAITAFVGMGLGVDLTLTGSDLIRLLLGPGWEESGKIFTFLALGIGLMFIHTVHAWIHLSIGRADRLFRWSLVEFVVTGLLFIPGLAWGPEGIAVSWTVSYALLTVPAFWYAGKPIRLGITPVMAAIWKYVFASAVAGCVTAFALQNLPPYLVGSGLVELATRVVGISVLFLILYLAGVVLLHRGWEPLAQFVMLVREMIFPRRKADSAPSVVQSQIRTAESASFQIQAEETTVSGGS